MTKNKLFRRESFPMKSMRTSSFILNLFVEMNLETDIEIHFI